MTENKDGLDSEHRGVEGLTEVLRLQAEALSRISERMSGMGSAGVKFPPPPSGKAPRQDSMNLPALAGDPALSEESLPVLNSFKQFLDQERRRGRKRFIWGVLGLVVVFACVLAVLVKLNSERVRSLTADLEKTSTRIERSQLSTEAELKKVSNQAAQTAAKNVATVRSDITRNILWAHSTLASNMNTELTDRDSQIERLKEKVSTLEVDNTMLTRQVAELIQRVQIIETDYLDNIDRPSLALPAPEAVGRPVSNAIPATGRTAPLTINSARYGRPLQMQVPKE
jgi:hypothetical protein